MRNIFIIQIKLCLILIICSSTASLVKCQRKYGHDSYYQIMKEFSFNLRNRNEENQRDVLYKNFIREGDSVFYDNHIVLSPKKNNTYGLIYTKGKILTNQMELQVKFRINNERGFGSAFAIWFFQEDMDSPSNDSQNSPDRSLIGFKSNFSGMGLIVMTPPKLLIDAKTIILLKINEGKEIKEISLKSVSHHNSCNENFHGRTVKLTIKIFGNQNKMQVNFNTPENLHYPCLRDFELNENDFKLPFRVGISAMNGMIENEEYLDRVEIEKFTLFNMDRERKKSYTNEFREFDLPRDFDSDGNSEANLDLIQNFSRFKKNLDKMDNPLFIEKINSKLDNSIIYISDLKKNLEREEESEKDLQKMGEIYNVYKEYINLLHEKLQEFKEKFKDFNTDGMGTVRNSSSEYSLKSSSIEYEILIREINKLKKEWDNNRVKHTLNNQLNLMLSDKIEHLVKSLKETEGINNKMALKLVIT